MVGAHTGDITTDYKKDVPAETHVVIGDIDGKSFTSGVPTVQRNAYGGGEGGAVYGTTHLTLYNGYVGYQYNTTSKKYEEKIEKTIPKLRPTPYSKMPVVCLVAVISTTVVWTRRV